MWNQDAKHGQRGLMWWQPVRARGIKLSLEKKGPFKDLAFTLRKKKWRSVGKDEGKGRIQS